MRNCHLCKRPFELTKQVYQTDLLYGQLSIMRDTDWQDMVLTVLVRNSNDEDVLLCKRCLAGALFRCAKELGKTNIPMTAGIQFKGF